MFEKKMFFFRAIKASESTLSAVGDGCPLGDTSSPLVPAEGAEAARHQPLDYGLLDEVDERVSHLVVTPLTPKLQRLNNFVICAWWRRPMATSKKHRLRPWRLRMSRTRRGQRGKLPLGPHLAPFRLSLGLLFLGGLTPPQSLLLMSSLLVNPLLFLPLLWSQASLVLRVL